MNMSNKKLYKKYSNRDKYSFNINGFYKRKKR